MEDFSEEDEFAAAIGRAVVAFTGLETKASVVFSSLLKAENKAGAMNVLWRMNNFAQRVEAMDVAARWLFGLHSKNDELMAEWEGLRGRLHSASDLRNRIAHSELGELEVGDRFEFYLRQPFTDWSRMDPRKMEKGARAKFDRNVREETVKSAPSQFEKLISDLHWFQEKVDLIRVSGETE